MSCSSKDIPAGKEEVAKTAAAPVEHGHGDGEVVNGDAPPHCRKDADDEEDEEEEEKVPKVIDLGPRVSIKDQLEKDKVRCSRFRKRHCRRNHLQRSRLRVTSMRFLISCTRTLQDDESLRRWKEQLLGSVDLNSVGGKPAKPHRTGINFQANCV